MSNNPFSADDNPYQAPQITTSVSNTAGGKTDLSGAASMLRQTKPWVRFISVMLFIGAGFCVLGGLIFLGGGLARAMPGPFGGALGFIYIVMAFLYVVPGIFLWAYADRIGVFLSQRTPTTLALALESQKSFWRFVGIVMAVIMCLYGLLLMLLFVGAFASV